MEMEAMSMDMNTRVERLRTMLAEGRIIRGAWVEGYDRACLLAALSPEVALAQRPSACPSSVMPAWLAHMTPHIDDRTSPEAWPGIVRRYADLAARWYVLSPEAWERARVRVLLAIVREARTHVPASASAVFAAIDGVIGWLESGAPEDGQWRAEAAAWEAWPRATEDEAALYAASASLAASRAAKAAAWAAKAAAEAAWAAKAAAEAEAKAAEEAAWDRLSDSVLDAIEAECLRSEVARG